MNVANFSGGVDSTAMVLGLLDRGWEGTVWWIDTGAEMPESVLYVRMFYERILRPRGVRMWVIRPRLQGLALPEYCEAKRLVPLAWRRWCTVGYKVLPGTRLASEYNVEPHEQALGINAGEKRRMRERWYPLVEWGWDKRRCIDEIRAHGLPVPIKSRCWCCPFQRVREWRYIWSVHPGLWERAVAMEENSRPPTNSGRPGSREHLTFDPHGRFTLRELGERFAGRRARVDMIVSDAEEAAGCGGTQSGECVAEVAPAILRHYQYRFGGSGAGLVAEVQVDGEE